MSASNTASGDSSPRKDEFTLPFPFPIKRHRTYSMNERAEKSPLEHGVIKEFCREKGHGFIIPDDGSEELFVHVSDVDCEYVPRPGDKVTFKKVHVPPKNVKYMAVHVTIVHLHEGEQHDTWESIKPKGTPGS